VTGVAQRELTYIVAVYLLQPMIGFVLHAPQLQKCQNLMVTFITSKKSYLLRLVYL